MLNIKYYVSVKETKLGTYYGVSELVEDLRAGAYSGKTELKGIEAVNEINKMVLTRLAENETLNQYKNITFKYETLEISKAMVQKMTTDEFYKNYKENRHALLQCSPAVFLSDSGRMNKAQMLMKSGMVLNGSIQKQSEGM